MYFKIKLLFILIIVSFYLSGCGVIQNALLKKYPNGQIKFSGELMPLSGAKNGEFKFFYEDGTLKSEGTYKDNKMVGIWSWYYPNGVKGQQQEFKYSLWTAAPYPHGEFYFWSEDGTIQKKGHFENGKKTGLWELWNSKGIKLIELTVDGNTPEGDCKMWYSSTGCEGVLKNTSQFHKGKHHGKLKAWQQDGQLMCEAVIDMGKIIDGKFFIDGKEIINNSEVNARINHLINSDIEYLMIIKNELRSLNPR